MSVDRWYWQKIMKTSKDDYENCDRLTERSADDGTQACSSEASAHIDSDFDTAFDDTLHIVSHWS